MANIQTYTEDFSHSGDWTSGAGCTVTTNTHAAPTFAGVNAGMADTVADTDAGIQGRLDSVGKTVPTDGTNWILSVYIRKTVGAPATFPEVGISFLTNYGAVSFNMTTGATSNTFGDPAPDASGVVDIDATWWRLWLKLANDTTASVNMFLFPARAATLGGPPDGGLTGQVVLWGANLTNTSTVQDYEPDPFYAFVAPRSFLLVR